MIKSHTDYCMKSWLKRCAVFTKYQGYVTQIILLIVQFLTIITL